MDRRLLRGKVFREIIIFRFFNSKAVGKVFYICDTLLFLTETFQTCFIFPGQGSQIIGMAKESTSTCKESLDLFDLASSLLGYNLLRMCNEGPKDSLDTTVCYIL